MISQKLRAVMLSGLLATGTQAAAQAPSTTARIDTGTLSGTAEKSTIAFRGIPYAAPPVGPLRWKAPQPPKAWTGVRDARSWGAACPQGPEHLNDFWGKVGPMNEDCLFLNVWRPKRAGKYPVMVFIHGGSFVYGAAGVPLYDGAALSERGAVIVTINYRLGRLGFFAHPALTKEDPEGLLGNYGIMDQVAALQWVKRNIAAFGGDSSNVTIFGESAGAGSVQILMATPSAQGLFHKAVSESGAGNSVLFPIRGGTVNAELVGQMWAAGQGLPNATPEQLRAVPVSEIIKGRVFPFNDGKVVVQSPGESFYRKTQAKVPMLIGANSNEASLGIPEDPVKAALGDQYQPLLAEYAAQRGKAPEDVAKQFVADVGFAFPSYAVADLHAASGQKTYAYYFDQVAVDQRAGSKGADHGGEVEYLFGNPAEHRWDAEDVRVSKLTGDYWVRFARTGNPNGGGAPNWPAVLSRPTTILYIGAKPRVKQLSPVEERMKDAGMAVALKQWSATTP